MIDDPTKVRDPYSAAGLPDRTKLTLATIVPDGQLLTGRRTCASLFL